MMMRLIPFSAVLLRSSLLLAGAASAQTSNYRSITVPAGKDHRIAVVTALKKDCSVGQIGGVRVVSPPKNGNLQIKRGKLKTPASFHCPNVETQAEAVFYQPRGKFTGDDEIVYETKSADGQVQRFTVKITVSDKAPAPSPAGDKDKKDEPLDL